MVADLTGDPLKTARRVVVKVGSALLVDASGLKRAWLTALAADVAQLYAEGKEALIVTSGAIALGRRELNLGAGALPLEVAQAAASVGQIALARAYAEALEAVGRRAGQALFTLGDTQARRRYLNGCATLKTLLELGVTPVVNENDAVATDEIRYGDNDRLAARVATMAGADALVLLSDVDGLYTGDPSRDATARRLDLVERITPEIEAMATGPRSETSRGGMVTKIAAAKIATEGGAAMIIAKGAPEGRGDRGPLACLRMGGAHTLFRAAQSPQSAKKQWIAGLKPMGRLVVDDGAAAALARGASLLPAGLRAVEGVFERGDAVELARLDGALIGAALASYGAEEARRIAGRKSCEIEALLGYPGRSAVAHRDDMALSASGRAVDKAREAAS